MGGVPKDQKLRSTPKWLAFLHYYTQAGIEMDEFNEALEDLYSLIKDYEMTTWDYNNFDIGEEEEEEEEEAEEEEEQE